MIVSWPRLTCSLTKGGVSVWSLERDRLMRVFDALQMVDIKMSLSYGHFPASLNDLSDI